jgi:hypothetical protein
LYDFDIKALYTPDDVLRHDVKPQDVFIYIHKKMY